MISSLQNEQVKHVVSLHTNKGRNQCGQFLIEGKRFLQEALLRDAKIIKIYYCSDNQTFVKDTESDEFKPNLSVPNLVNQAFKQQIPLEEVTEAVMHKMSTTKEPQRILAIAEQDEYGWTDIDLAKKEFILIIDGIQDPGNMGTILRTALAADIKNIILTKGTVDIYNTKVLRSSMGAIFSIKILMDKTPEEITNFCKANNFILTVSTMEGASIYQEKISEHIPLALVLGNEAFGPAEIFLREADKKLSIPMFNTVESLNVAIAAGIFLFEIRRQLGFL
ncbi:MAG: rRNA methyltransferase [Gracilibacter sp. BRH_c7a]|nr:MAG: rRNA methyltransferase [Gracilibacter sp. BRH_c7a]